MLTATAAPHPAAFPQSSPMRDDPRLRGPKVLFDANALERDG